MLDDEKMKQIQALKPGVADAIDAMFAMNAAIQADSDYAWSWHCNVAMPFQDEGGTHEQANRAAARFMQTAFGVDVTTFDQWLAFDWAKLR